MQLIMLNKALRYEILCQLIYIRLNYTHKWQ